METIIGYTYEICFNGELIHTDEEVFEEKQDAISEAESYIDEQIFQYKADGTWNEDDSREDFSISINEVTEPIS